MALHFYPQPKPRPAKLAKADRTKARLSEDKAESAKVRVRSGGMCECSIKIRSDSDIDMRCCLHATHVHHMIGGIGVRGRGISAKAIHKQHLCAQCHADIGAHVLVRIGEAMPHWTDRYRRMVSS